MSKNQEINCTVTSCKYNNNQNKKCELNSIQVAPIDGCDIKEADESKCASYKNLNN